jgi:hypothetical protein
MAAEAEAPHQAGLATAEVVVVVAAMTICPATASACAAIAWG